MDESSRTGSLADEPAELPPLFVAPGGEGVKADAVGTGGALGFVETVIPAGHSTPLHVHRHEHEAFYVLTGAVDFVCSDRRFRAEAGAFVFSSARSGAHVPWDQQRSITGLGSVRAGRTRRCFHGAGALRRDPPRARRGGRRPASALTRGTISRVTSRPAAAQHLSDLARLRRVRDRIDREYAQPLDVEALARGAHMSAGHLSRQFRLAYGESPYSYLMTRRIERAMALLRRGDLSVTEVCFAVGCSSLGTFSTRFTELVGMPPSVYRRQAAGAMAGMPPCVAKQVTRPIRNREAPVPSRS